MLSGRTGLAGGHRHGWHGSMPGSGRFPRWAPVFHPIRSRPAELEKNLSSQVVAPTSDTVSGRRTASSESVMAADGSRTRVLLVEDHVINQKVVTRMLDRLGCVVELAEDGNVGV